MKQALLGAIIFLVAQSAPQSTQRSVQPTATPSTEINFFSPKQDIEIGADSALEAEKELTLVRDLHVNQFLRSIVQRVVPNSPTRALRYRFQIVNSNDVSSLGFPNGTVYLYRGLLSLASNEDEVAALVAHEVAHIALRHPTKQLSRQLLVQAPISISNGLPTMEEWKDQLGKLGIVFGVNAPFLHYNPEQEVEAAALASELLSSARFDEQALTTVFQKVKEAGKNPDEHVPTFLYNHRVPESNPESDPEAARVGGLRVKRPTPEFRAFSVALDRLPKPVEKEPEDLNTDALPNLYSHPQNYYKLNYPDNWQITRTLNDGAIIAAPDGLLSTRSGDDVTHGVMFDMFDLSTSDKPLTLEQATNRLIVYLRQRNQTVRAVPGAQTPTLLHNEPALRTVLLRGGLVRNGNADVIEGREVLWLVTRMYYQNLFYMVFVAPEEEFPTHQQMFEQMIRSVQFIQ
jgi:Zn-dependent protease with chaperone function